MRLHDDISSQEKTAAALARILSRKKGVALAKQPSMGHVGTKIANNILKSIGVGLGTNSVLALYNLLEMLQRAHDKR